VRGREASQRTAHLPFCYKTPFFQATMRPLLFSKSRVIERRAHGGLRVTFPFVFSPLADKQGTRSTPNICGLPVSMFIVGIFSIKSQT